MIYDMNAPAKAVKGRMSRKVVHYFEPSAQKQREQATAPVQAPGPAEVSGGKQGSKAWKTGMVLTRAKLGTATSEIAATRDRQSALLSKGMFRDAEKVAREAATGTLKTSRMPKRKNAVGTSAHQAEFRHWMKQTLSGKVPAAFEPAMSDEND